MGTFIGVHFLIYIIIFGQFGSYREAIRRRLRHDGASKSMIKKLTKGKRNYWWFEAIHEKYGIGILYPLNKLLTVLLPFSIVFSLLFIWFSFGKYLCAVLNTVLMLCCLITYIYSSMQDNYINFGSYFVILGVSKDSNRRVTHFNSSFLDIFMFLVMCMCIRLEWWLLVSFPNLPLVY